MPLNILLSTPFCFACLFRDCLIPSVTMIYIRQLWLTRAGADVTVFYPKHLRQHYRRQTKHGKKLQVSGGTVHAA